MDLRAARLQNLPQVVLEKVFGYLHLRDVSRLGRECVSFRIASKCVLGSAMRRLVASVEQQMVQLEASSEEVNDWDPAVSAKYLHIALLHTVLKVCQSELHVVQACCWRYMRDPTVNFCFPAGDLLDEYYYVLSLVRDREVNKELEPEITTHLFLRTEKFLDLFDTVLEPGLAGQGCAVPPGMKIMDVLDCCQTSNYQVRLTHASDSAYMLAGAYELRDIGTIDKPPDTMLDMPTEMKLQSVTRFLRNHVRWNNLFNLLKELWDLEDSVENHIDGDTRPLSPLCRSFCRMHSVDEEGGQCQDIFSRNILHIGTRIGVECTLAVQARQLPLCLEWLEGARHVGCIRMGIETGVKEEANSAPETRVGVACSCVERAVQTDMFFPTREEEVLGVSELGELDPVASTTETLEKQRGQRTFNNYDARTESRTDGVIVLSSADSVFEMELKIQTPSNTIPCDILESVIAVRQSGGGEIEVTAIKDGVLAC